MTQLWNPYREERPVPRLANLSARGGFRDDHWRKVRRRLDPCDVTPFDAEPEPSMIDRITEAYFASRWAPWALLAIACATLGYTLVIVAGAIAEWIGR